MRQNDLVFSRKGYRLDDLVKERIIPNRFVSWENGHEILDVIKREE
jgi:hypothetical protein